jgi:DNA invertase Pin-like site-specific DNA recombinase
MVSVDVSAGQRAIAYVRVSVVGDRAARGRFESPDMQRAAIDAWARPRAVQIVREVRDLNRSGGTLTRPGLTDALALLRDGAADGIVVARSDRASRRTLDGLGLIEDLERGGWWIAAADGTIDTTSRAGRMATTMFFAAAQNEYERYREQSAESHRRAIVERGRHMGPAPLGYARDSDGRLVPHPDLAWVPGHVFARRAAGAGWVTISRELDEPRRPHPRRPARQPAPPPPHGPPPRLRRRSPARRVPHARRSPAARDRGHVARREPRAPRGRVGARRRPRPPRVAAPRAPPVRRVPVRAQASPGPRRGAVGVPDGDVGARSDARLRRAGAPVAARGRGRRAARHRLVPPRSRRGSRRPHRRHRHGAARGRGAGGGEHAR